MTAVLRQACRSDIRVMQRVRASVLENRLVSRVITDADVLEAMESTGRGWVVELDGEVVGFAIGNAQTGNIWALFLEPQHERRGYGRQLHDTMLDWMWSQGLEKLWLSTEPGTRAERFYEVAGWRRTGSTAQGEVHFEMLRPGPPRHSTSR